jgi:hypothetical protein
MLNNDSLFSDEEIIPFPEEGERLFTSEKYSHYNAQIGYDRHNDDALFRYVSGYKEAGDRLVRSLMEDSRHLDLVVYPTVFLYRQYLELRLKQLIREGSYLLEKPFALRKQHRLDTLWYECKSLLKQIEPKVTDQEIAGLEACIIEFHTIDPFSMAFRYHVDTKDNPSLPSDLRYINIPNLAKVMAKINSFLDAVYMTISVALDRKQEMEEALKDYYPSEEDWRDYYGIPDEYPYER